MRLFLDHDSDLRLHLPNHLTLPYNRIQTAPLSLLRHELIQPRLLTLLVSLRSV